MHMYIVHDNIYTCTRMVRRERPEEDVSSPVLAGGVAGTPALFSLLKLSRLGFCATTGEGRGALDPLVSRRPPIPGTEAGSRGEGGAVGYRLSLNMYTPT